jgi:hypothetical protein
MSGRAAFVTAAADSPSRRARLTRLRGPSVSTAVNTAVAAGVSVRAPVPVSVNMARNVGLIISFVKY